MRDRSAALVDITSFLFLFALVLFVTSTNGAIDPPQRPTQFLSIQVTPVMTGDQRLTIGCQPIAPEDIGDVGPGDLVLSVYLRVDDRLVTGLDASQNCFSASATAGDPAVARLLLASDARPTQIVLLPSHIGASANIGSVQPLEVRINGSKFCSNSSLDPVIGAFGPVILEPGESCT